MFKQKFVFKDVMSTFEYIKKNSDGGFVEMVHCEHGSIEFVFYNKGDEQIIIKLFDEKMSSFPQIITKNRLPTGD